MNKVPDKIDLGTEEYVLVTETDLPNGKLGCLDTGNGVIMLNKDQPEVGKHLILLHELSHLVAVILKEKGIIKRHPDENFITHFAGVLFPMLAMSGLWSGVSKEECLEFMLGQIDENGNWKK